MTAEAHPFDGFPVAAVMAAQELCLALWGEGLDEDDALALVRVLWRGLEEAER